MTHVKIGLLVTGRGEERFLPGLFKPIMASFNCSFQVERWFPQLTPRSSPTSAPRTVGTNKLLPTRDQELGLTVRAALEKYHYVVLVDDLEGDRRPQARAVLGRYHDAMAAFLGAEEVSRTSAHFLVNMIEAYFLAHGKACGTALGITLEDWPGDVEDIRHPKGELRKHHPPYHEIDDAGKILSQLDVQHILKARDRCASLRSLMAWSVTAVGKLTLCWDVEPDFGLDDGIQSAITGSQIRRLML